MRDWKSEITSRLPDRSAVREDVLEEMAQHLEERYQMLVQRGFLEAHAYSEVLQELSDSAVVTAMLRPSRRPSSTDMPVLGDRRAGGLRSGWGRDLRYAGRMLAKRPGFTAAALVVLALGVGVNTAIFSVLNTVMLRPLPFADPDRLVRIWESNPGNGWLQFGASHPNFLDWRSQSRIFERLAAAAPVEFSLTSEQEVDIVRGAAVTADFLSVLGVSPATGRSFSEEDRPASDGGGARVVVISHALWQRRLNGERNVLQRTLLLNGTPWTIVGVLPKTFLWDGSQIDVLVPLGPDPTRARGDHRLRVIGKLRSSTTIDQARAELSGIAGQLAAQFPDSNRGWTVRLLSFRDWLVPTETRQALLVFAGAAALVLLIACGNVASLLLARGTERQKELAIRAALGAERARIVRQLLVEAVLLSLVAAALALAIAQGATRLLVAYSPDVLPRLGDLYIDIRVLAFALLSALVTALLFGVVPAVQASRPSLTATLREGAAGAGGSTRLQLLRNALVVGEVALSVTLLIGAGLLMRSFWHLQHVDPGFDGPHTLTVRLTLSSQQYPTRQAKRLFYDRLLEAVRALPGVEGAATTSIVPLGAGNTSTAVVLAGRAPEAGQLPGADWRTVSSGYFRMMRIPLLGRDFADTDTPTSQPVAILSEAAARTYFPGQDPIGRSVIVPAFQDEPMTVIGVAGDVRHIAIDTDPGPVVYGSARVFPAVNPMFLAIRTSRDLASLVPVVRAQVRAIDPTVPVYDVRTGDELIAESLGPRRFNTYLLGCVAGLALLLASVGLFGVMAYLVSLRTRDIGIRLALGATPFDVVRLVLGEGLALTLAGLVFGIGGGIVLTSAMRSLLYAVGPTDALTLVCVSILLVGVAMLACYVPARRAMRVDPLVALRSE